MDRRGFFKSILITPLLTPFLLASKTTSSDLELFLIASDSHLFLPLILDELQKYGLAHGRSFTLLNSHPKARELKHILSKKGWTYVEENPMTADLSLSFSLLHHKAVPSFTLVKEGRVWDIRSQKLFALWNEMNKSHILSSCLTTVSFKNSQSIRYSGEYVSLYKDGRKVGRISLAKNFSKSFRTQGGKITVQGENGKVWVSESSCHHKICLYTPPASLAGERIICAPNHFLLEVNGAHSSVDTVIG